MGMTSHTADGLADQLSLDILRGDLAPGARLPSVRELARQHQVSASTVQRVLMSLEARGLVHAQDRSGVTVLDPRRHASLSVWPLLAQHADAAPGLGFRLLDDVLATRRTLALDVLKGVLNGNLEEAERVLGPEIDAFVDLAEDAEPSVLCAAEHELLRSVLVLAERPAVLGILNGIERVFGAVPALVEALYRDPSGAVAAWNGLRMLLGQPDPLSMLPMIEAALSAADVHAMGLATDLLTQDRP